MKIFSPLKILIMFEKIVKNHRFISFIIFDAFLDLFNEIQKT